MACVNRSGPESAGRERSFRSAQYIGDGLVEVLHHDSPAPHQVLAVTPSASKPLTQLIEQVVRPP